MKKRRDSEHIGISPFMKIGERLSFTFLYTANLRYDTNQKTLIAQFIRFPHITRGCHQSVTTAYYLQIIIADLIQDI